mmetsp:Transcript_41648/g.126269  ORF Transcript_41648/g.126269 Transcript_41648/m.126269 type:complete len:203 (-) Transcript_41648:182-790(-)
MSVDIPKAGEGEVLREVHLKVDSRFALISVRPKPDETNDANFPRNLHNAAELFLRVGMVECAERLKDDTSSMLDRYATNPDGRTGLRIGRAVVCWSCGHCGLPDGGGSGDGDGGKEDDRRENAPPRPCGRCGETEQTNWLRFSQKRGETLPWIETAPLSKEEKKKREEADRAAKRAEVEANVKRALAERVSKELEAASASIS